MINFQSPPIRSRLHNPPGLGDHRPRADELELQRGAVRVVLRGGPREHRLHRAHRGAAAQEPAQHQQGGPHPRARRLPRQGQGPPGDIGRPGYVTLRKLNTVKLL